MIGVLLDERFERSEPSPVSTQLLCLSKSLPPGGADHREGAPVSLWSNLMTSEQSSLHLLMLSAGFGIPVMAAANANLARSLGSTFLAVAILCSVASLIAFGLLLLHASGGAERVWPENIACYTAGIFFVIYIGSITYTSPRIGLGNAIFLVLVGQLISAAIIDHYGWFGSTQSPITVRRLVGLSIMVVGTYFARNDPLV